MPKSKKYLSLLLLPFLFSCGEKPNVSSSEPVSSETPSISSEIPTKDVFSSFIEKGKPISGFLRFVPQDLARPFLLILSMAKKLNFNNIAMISKSITKKDIMRTFLMEGS